jgi:Domain of unknown function (DUF5666)
MRARSRLLPVIVMIVAAALFGLGACGGGNPAGSDGSGVVVRGTVSGASAFQAGLVSAHASAAALTVSLADNPTISTTVDADGSFTLRGLPSGGFTLVFSSGGTELGRLSFSEVKPNQELTLTVQVSSSGVVLLEEKRDGIGHGDVEIEGNVAQVISLTPAEGRFLINGRTVVARPLETAVREGNRSRNIEDVTEGRHVHVKGVWMTPEASGQPVLAHEIMLQGDQTDDPGRGRPSTRCVSGDNVQVEGKISAKSGGSITVDQQGQGSFLCSVSGSTRIRKGNTNYTMSQLQVGWRVHVSGQGMGEAGGMCQVAADEIKVQQD